MRNLIKFLWLFLLMSCAGQQTVQLLPTKWDKVSFSEVYLVVDETIPEECLEVINQSYLLYAETHKIEYLHLEYASYDWPGFIGIVPPGSISIHLVGELGKDITGVAHRERFGFTESDCSQKSCVDYEPLKSVDIEIKLCSYGTVAHEIGHALGLDHVTVDADNLMFPVWEKGSKLYLAQWQVDWIR